MIIALTTILHLVVYALFALAFLANAIITRAKSYWFLLAICLLQCGSDIALMAWPGDFNVDAIVVAYVFLLIAVLGITLISTRLLHIWSSSVKGVVPRYPHRLAARVVRVLLVFYVILAIVALTAIGFMTNERRLATAFFMWYGFMWGYALFTLVIAVLSGLVGWRKIHAMPPSLDIHRKRNQIIRLFILNIILFLYFALDGFGLLYYTYLEYAGYILLFCWFSVAAWPRALANYHLKPGQPSPPDSHDNSLVNAAEAVDELDMSAVEEGRAMDEEKTKHVWATMEEVEAAAVLESPTTTTSAATAN